MGIWDNQYAPATGGSGAANTTSSSNTSAGSGGHDGGLPGTRISALDFEAVLLIGLTEVESQAPPVKLARRICYAIGRFTVEHRRSPLCVWNLRDRGIVGAGTLDDARAVLRDGDEYAVIVGISYPDSAVVTAWYTVQDLADLDLIDPDDLVNPK